MIGRMTRADPGTTLDRAAKEGCTRVLTTLRPFWRLT